MYGQSFVPSAKHDSITVNRSFSFPVDKGLTSRTLFASTVVLPIMSKERGVSSALLISPVKYCPELWSSRIYLKSKNFLFVGHGEFLANAGSLTQREPSPLHELGMPITLFKWFGLNNPILQVIFLTCSVTMSHVTGSEWSCISPTYDASFVVQSGKCPGFGSLRFPSELKRLYRCSCYCRTIRTETSNEQQ